MRFDKYFSKICRENSSFIRNLTRMTGTLHEDPCILMIISRSILFRMGNVWGKNVEKIKIQILFSLNFSLKSCRLWVYLEKYGRSRQATDDNIMRRMLFACRITKATHTHTLRMCNTFWVSTTTMVTRKRLNVTRVRTLPLLLTCYSSQVFPSLSRLFSSVLPYNRTHFHRSFTALRTRNLSEICSSYDIQFIY
jgi:hypothetical protein